MKIFKFIKRKTEKDKPDFKDYEVLAEMNSLNSKKVSWFYKKGLEKSREKMSKRHLDKEKQLEIYQDAFIVLWKDAKKGKFIVDDAHNLSYINKKGEINKVEDLQAWLMGVVENKIKEVFREIPEDFNRRGNIDYVIHALNNSPYYDDLTAKKEHAINLIRKYVERMEGKCRTILFCYYWSPQLTRNDIAEEAGFQTNEGLSRKKKECLKKLRNSILKETDISTFDFYSV